MYESTHDSWKRNPHCRRIYLWPWTTLRTLEEIFSSTLLLTTLRCLQLEFFALDAQSLYPQYPPFSKPPKLQEAPRRHGLFLGGKLGNTQPRQGVVGLAETTR